MLEERIKSHHKEREKLLLEAASKNGVSDGDKFIYKSIPQSTLFMAEIIPLIHRLYLHLPETTYKSALDVGPENFAGTALLQQIHHPKSFCRLKLNVTAIDIHDRFEYLRQIVAPDVEFVVDNIFNVKERVWDFGIASHVIEHVPEPIEFAQQLQKLSRDFVIFATPYNEKPIITPGHVNTIDRKFLRDIGARDVNVFTNYSWGKDRDVVIFWLPGQA